MSTVLAPYRVVDLTSERGMLAGRILADLGADVIKVELPEGDPVRRVGPYLPGRTSSEASLRWIAWNINKRGVVLDWRTAEGRSALVQLVQRADIVLESAPPGKLAAYGLGYHELAKVNPRLIYVSITPFGQDGPRAGWKATDLTLQALGGMAFVTGDEDRPPLRISAPQAWLHASAHAAAMALLALRERRRSGLGQWVDVAALPAVVWTTMNITGFPTMMGVGVVQRRTGGYLQLAGERYRVIYPCKDGYVHLLIAGGISGPSTTRFVQWMRAEGMASQAICAEDWYTFTARLFSGEVTRETLRSYEAEIESFLKTKTKAELFERALAEGFTLAPINDIADIVHDRHLSVREYWQEIPESAGGYPFPLPGPFARFSATPIRYRRPAPRLGEHTAEVLAEVAASASPPGQARLPTTGERQSALAGLRVLDLSWLAMGPLVARTLADYGATVIRVESARKLDPVRQILPFKDGIPGVNRSQFYGNLNVGKLGITIDLTTERGRDLVRRLACWADVLIESFTPGTMETWGLSYKELKVLNPRLIMMSATLCGQTGPYRTYSGVGTMAAALIGFYNLTGWPDRPPVGPYGAYTDYVAPHFGLAALLAALDYRDRTGEGQYIDLAQLECGLHFLAPEILDYLANGQVAQRAGNTSLRAVPHGIFPCAGEDRWIALAVCSDEEWQTLCRLMGRDDLARDPQLSTLTGRLAGQAIIETAVADWTANQEGETLVERLQECGIAAGLVQTGADLQHDPQLAHRGFFLQLPHSELGLLIYDGVIARLSATPARPTRGAPCLGEHTAAVLREILGLTDEEIADLAMAGCLM
jgi:crotonobetainyl-CoA:carnitine CoA-transferase CaiB-like acyl-CoA transferase